MCHISKQKPGLRVGRVWSSSAEVMENCGNKAVIAVMGGIKMSVMIQQIL